MKPLQFIYVNVICIDIQVCLLSIYIRPCLLFTMTAYDAEPLCFDVIIVFRLSHTGLEILKTIKDVLQNKTF